MELNLLRRIARERVKSELVLNRVAIFRKELPGEIRFNVSGMKECINQPFKFYVEKVNLIICGLEEALLNSDYVGYTTHQTHSKPHIKGYHYFKTKIGGCTAYFNIQRTIQNQYFLYSITESIQIKSLQKST